MTAPKSSDGAGPTALIFIFLTLVLAIVIAAAGGIIPPSIWTPPSQCTLQARVFELETQVSELSPQTPPARVDTSTPVLNTPTPKPTRTGPALITLSVIAGAANVRAGPGIAHEVLGVVQKGQTLRGPYQTQNGWYQVCCVDDKRGWISGELVDEWDRPITDVPPTSTRTPAPTWTPPKPIPAPPAWLNPHGLYKWHLNVNGAHILGTDDVSSRSLRQARDILLGMTSTRVDLFAAMTRTGLKIIIFDSDATPLHTLPDFQDWPLAPFKAGGFLSSAAGYTIAAPDTNLKCSPILVHEIAHAIDDAIEPSAPWFTEERDKAYQNAMETGLWNGEYAETNKHEYFAEAVARHFRRQAGESVLLKKDPKAAALIAGVFGEAKISPCR